MLVHRMVSTFLETKTRGDVYRYVKKIIDDAISVRPRMIENSLKCAERRQKYKISNNQILDKEEAEIDKSDHQPSVLGLISTTNVNGLPPLTLVEEIRPKTDG